MKLRSAILIGLLQLVVLAMQAAPASAEVYPDRPVHIILTATAGGGADVLARLVAQAMDGVLKQSFVVENKADASAIVGPQTVAAAKPDGYTVLLNASTHVILPYLLQSMPFDADNDFTPITQLAKSPFVLCVTPAMNIATLADFVRYAKSKPGVVNVGVAGIGTPDHIAMEFFEREAKIETLKVPYKGGAPALIAALSGNVDAVMLPPLLVKQHVEAGKLKALAITSSERSESMPDVPSIANSGYPKFEFYSWYGFWGPKGMPQDRVETFQRAVATVLSSADVERRLNELGVTGVGSAPEAFGAFVKSESARYGILIRERNIPKR